MTVTGTDTLTGREYLRVSRDRSGRMTSPEEQHNANAADAEREGITLGAAYAETRDVSASLYSDAVRDGFAALMADLERGRFGADVLYLWENSRGSRRVGEWVDLLDATARCGVLIRVTTHGRTYDPRSGRDRRLLIDDANDSEYESYKTSARTRRSAAASAAAGRPHGAAPWGYVPVYDPRSGRLVTWEPDGERAPLVAELFDRIAGGHSLRGIAADWRARGVANSGGKRFSPQHLRDMATRPAYAGLRSHNGEVTQGVWEAIVSAERYWTVQRILSDPARKTTRGGRAKYALTMIMRCGVCGGPIAALERDPARPRYFCRDRSCVTIERPATDDVVVGAMLGYLSRDDVYASLTTGGQDSPELEDVRAELAAARAELTQAENAAPESVAEARMMARLVETLTGKVGELEQRERELTTPAALLRLIEPGADVGQRWKDAEVSTRREVARLLLRPEVLGEVRIHRSPVPGHPAPVADRIEWWRGDS